MRPLVLRTALTYLELLGVLRQGTPYYAAYEVKPSRPLSEIAAELEAGGKDRAAAAERAHFITRLFAQAKKGRIWYAIQPDAAAEALREPRDRIVRALDHLQEKGWAELRASEVRHRYRRLRLEEDAAALVDDLGRRFEARERHEIARLAQVLDLVTHPGCQVNRLVGHFGEVRTEPCGHCTRCLTGAPQPLPPAIEPPPLPACLDLPSLRALREQHPTALGHPRQATRFLCGLTSPATSRARLGQHPLFGALEGRRFAEVLTWCERLP
jgi:ATP-dependent DNA helicase RecQ